MMEKEAGDAAAAGAAAAAPAAEADAAAWPVALISLWRGAVCVMSLQMVAALKVKGPAGSACVSSELGSKPLAGTASGALFVA
jgi:hypothetical protein